MKRESILAIEAEHINFLHPDLIKNGIAPITYDEIVKVITDNRLWLAPREEIEHRKQFRQIIPSIVIKIDNKILLYQRTNKGGDPRLFNKYSITLGGHISSSDMGFPTGPELNLSKLMAENITRELREEVPFLNLTTEFYKEAIKKENIKYIINCNKTDVSTVHVGIVSIVRASTLGNWWCSSDIINLINHTHETKPLIEKTNNDEVLKVYLMDPKRIREQYYTLCEEWTCLLLDEFVK